MWWVDCVCFLLLFAVAFVVGFAVELFPLVCWCLVSVLVGCLFRWVVLVSLLLLFLFGWVSFASACWFWLL